MSLIKSCLASAGGATEILGADVQGTNVYNASLTIAMTKNSEKVFCIGTMFNDSASNVNDVISATVNGTNATVTYVDDYTHNESSCTSKIGYIENVHNGDTVIFTYTPAGGGGSIAIAAIG